MSESSKNASRVHFESSPWNSSYSILAGIKAKSQIIAGYCRTLSRAKFYQWNNHARSQKFAMGGGFVPGVIAKNYQKERNTSGFETIYPFKLR